jgi:uncharacterized protein
MKCTLLVTRQCNLRCKYCYVGKDTMSMPIEQAQRSIDLTFQRAQPREQVDFAFFGGEPLLELAKVCAITDFIESHPGYDPERVRLTLVTNGTIFNDKIADFVKRHRIAFGISCDGPPAVHDRFRVDSRGRGSSLSVEQTLRHALDSFARVMVNAVYRPETFHALPETLDYFSALGVRQIYLSPDYSAPWTAEDTDSLASAYEAVGERYINYYGRGDPHFISLVDSKIAVILRGGYRPQERCRMGTGELAITPDGSIYPCERLVGQVDEQHRIGHLDQGIEVELMGSHRADSARSSDTLCSQCSMKDFCMNWCGCSNYFASGYYNRVSAFLCASERAAIATALHVYQRLEQNMSGLFLHHLAGSPLTNSVQCRSQPCL